METELGSNNQEVSPPACKNTGIGSVHVAHGSVSLELFPVDISEVPECHLLVSRVLRGWQKLLQV